MARNKEFDDALDELKMLHDAKNSDYSTLENPYKNLPEYITLLLFPEFKRLKHFP